MKMKTRNGKIYLGRAFTVLLLSIIYSQEQEVKCNQIPAFFISKTLVALIFPLLNTIADITSPTPPFSSPPPPLSLPTNLLPCKMVVALGPGRFYGSSLPRPRFFPDPKLNSTRVDPPESVMDPFLSWANDAHWSMGGLSFRRLRLQGRIEGSISKLRKMSSPKRRKTSSRFTKQRLAVLDEEDDEPETDEEVYDSDSEEEVDQEDEEEEEESEEEIVVSSKKRKRVRRLGDEFDRIAEEARKKEKEHKKVNRRGKKMEKEPEKPRRVSPRKK